MMKMEKKKAVTAVSSLLCSCLLLNSLLPVVSSGAPAPTAEAASEAEWAEVQEIISSYYGEWTSPEFSEAVNNRIPNTALLGNGDVGISSDGDATTKRFRISKGDFWEYNNSPLKVGSISLTAREQAGNTDADFYEKEDILNARIQTQQTLGNVPLQIESWMSATENLFVMEITSLSQTAEAELRVTLESYIDGNRPTTAEIQGDSMVVTRSTHGGSQTNPKSYISKVAMATRVMGADGDYTKISDSAAEVALTLPAGASVYVVTAICGGGQTYGPTGTLSEGRIEPTDEAAALLNTCLTPESVEQLRRAHLTWWKDYWMQSYIKLDTDNPNLALLQKYYYAAQYELGCAIREGNIAAGLYGIWHTTDTPSWHSDYHLNYNFISTYYGLASSNRVSMLLPAVEALMDYVPQGIENAGSFTQLCAVYPSFALELLDRGQVDRQHGIPNAILFPVAIGPYGMTLEKNAYHHETVNAPFSAFPMIEYYNYTQDETFMRDTLYVYLKHVLTFLEHWIIEEDGVYTLYAGYNEGSWSINPALELAAYKTCLKYGIRISEQLGVDADRRATWEKIYNGMADQPVVEDYNGTGRTVLALAEKEWINDQWVSMNTPVPGDGNCIPLEALVPCEVFGYYSPDETLETLQNTVQLFSKLGAWTQINNFPKLAPSAVNARFDCHQIINGLARSIRSHMKQNMMIDDGIHGIEKAGATKAINNMMLLSDQGVIKLFGNWLEDTDAKFCRLRASGAFVFSAAYDGDAREISEGVTMYSEAGASATVASLWEEGMVVLDENGRRVEATVGTAPNHEEEITYTFDTEAGKTYTLIKVSSYVEPVETETSTETAPQAPADTADTDRNEPADTITTASDSTTQAEPEGTGCASTLGVGTGLLAVAAAAAVVLKKKET